MSAAPAAALVTAYSRTAGLLIRASPGELNQIEAGFFGAPPFGFLPFEYEVRDGAPVVPSGGCHPDGSGASCAITGVRALTVDLGDGAENSFRYFGTGDVTLRAADGADTVRSGAGFDLIQTGGGADSLRGGEGNDILRAGDGNDRLLGEGGDDELDGGPGKDDFDAGPGNDRILARDGVADTIDCGPGIDTLIMDLRDGKPPRSCERVDQRATDEGPNVRVRRERVSATREGIVGVPLACPRAVRRGCAGRLSITVRGAGTAARRYALRRGRRAVVRLRLRAAARRGLTRGRSLRARLVSVERGVHGPKTTIRPLVVRGRATARRAGGPGRTLRPAQRGPTSSTVSFTTGNGLRITGTRGARNDVTIAFLTSPARYRVRDDGNPIVAGRGCRRQTVTTVSCRVLGPRTIRARLGDRRDRLRFDGDAAGGADAVLDGGPGEDRIDGGDGYDVLIAGPDEGPDRLDGNGGNDALVGSAGRDTLIGGTGTDYVTGGAGNDRLFLRDGFVDFWCDSGNVDRELDAPIDDPPGGGVEFAGDQEVCPAAPF